MFVEWDANATFEPISCVQDIVYGFKTLGLRNAGDPAVVLAAALNTAQEAVTRLTAQPICNEYAHWPLLLPAKRLSGAAAGTPSYSAEGGEQFGAIPRYIHARLPLNTICCK